MSSPTRVLAMGEAVRLGGSDAPLSFSRPEPGGALGARRLQLEGADAYELSWWCGTCPLVFERLTGAGRVPSSEELEQLLNGGLAGIHETVLNAAEVLVPEATYVPLLLSVRPELVMPADASDYFAHEQVAHRGVEPFWGIPHHPKTPYYRGGTSALGEHEFLFEFVVPMVPPSWNQRERVDEYEGLIRSGAEPTVFALGILDHTQPFDSRDAHTGLMHFVLDGHHKLEAAARLGVEIQVLSLVSLDDSLGREEAERVLAGLQSLDESADPTAPSGREADLFSQ